MLQIYGDAEIFIYYIGSTTVIDCLFKTSTIHGEVDLIRYAIEIPAELMHMICYT